MLRSSAGNATNLPRAGQWSKTSYCGEKKHFNVSWSKYADLNNWSKSDCVLHLKTSHMKKVTKSTVGSFQPVSDSRQVVSRLGGCDIPARQAQGRKMFSSDHIFDFHQYNSTLNDQYRNNNKNKRNKTNQYIYIFSKQASCLISCDCELTFSPQMCIFSPIQIKNSNQST